MPSNGVGGLGPCLDVNSRHDYFEPATSSSKMPRNFTKNAFVYINFQAYSLRPIEGSPRRYKGMPDVDDDVADNTL